MLLSLRIYHPENQSKTLEERQRKTPMASASKSSTIKNPSTRNIVSTLMSTPSQLTHEIPLQEKWSEKRQSKKPGHSTKS